MMSGVNGTRNTISIMSLIALVTFVLSVGGARYMSGESTGELIATVDQNKTTLVAHSPLVARIPVIENEVINIKEKIATSDASIRNIIAAINDHSDEFNEFKLEQVTFQSELLRRLPEQ
jgi:hypothetical protein